jgi:hypothetical protein
MSAAPSLAPAFVPAAAPTPSAPPTPSPAASENGVMQPQCMQALARANEVRLARARLKREVGAAERNVIEVVSDIPWEAETMPIGELLCSQRRWGRARSRKLLMSIHMSEAKPLGSLTPRQRRLLVGALEAKYAS